jgi:hypothetical protein
MQSQRSTFCCVGLLKSHKCTGVCVFEYSSEPEQWFLNDPNWVSRRRSEVEKWLKETHPVVYKPVLAEPDDHVKLQMLQKGDIWLSYSKLFSRPGKLFLSLVLTRKRETEARVLGGNLSKEK